MTLLNQPHMLLFITRACAPAVVVSPLAAIPLNPPLTFLNLTHLIAALQLARLLPIPLPTSPTNFPQPTCSTNKSRILHTKPIAPPASAAPAASYKSPYRKCPGGMLLRSPRMFRAGALVDRELRFVDNYR